MKKNNKKTDNNPSNVDKNNSESYFARGRKKRNKYIRIIIPAIIGVIALGIALALVFPSENIAAKYGQIGSAHEHAALLIYLNGTKVDLAQPKYMVRSNYIHVENFNGTLDGTTIHKHAINVPLGEFLKSLRMNIENGCFVTDNNQKYCNNNNFKLRFYVNGNETKDIMSYVLNDDDRILITYGNQNSTEIKKEMQELNKLPINKK